MRAIGQTRAGATLHAAVRCGHEEEVKNLLENGVSIGSKDECGYSPLHVAAEEGKVEMVEFLLLKGAKKTR